MKLKYFDDSYDIVKKSMLAWLAEFGRWSAHPMFTEFVPTTEAAAYSRFLNVDLVSVEVLRPDVDRSAYFSCGGSAGNLFLDPDTGISLNALGGRRSINYIFGDEITQMAHQRPDSLMLVFDQSYSYGKRCPQIRAKLEFLAARGVYSLAYNSHAPMLLLSSSEHLLLHADNALAVNSQLPPSRIVRGHPLQPTC